jgi:hypothetical protein
MKNACHANTNQKKGEPAILILDRADFKARKVIREMQIKTSIKKVHYTLFRMAKFQNTSNTKFWQGYRASELYLLLMGMQNGADTLKSKISIFYKTKQSLPIQYRNHASLYLPKGSENICPQKNLYTDVYSRFIHNC